MASFILFLLIDEVFSLSFVLLFVCLVDLRRNIMQSMLSIHNSVRLDWTVWEAIVSNVLSWCLMDRQYDSIHVTCDVFFHLTVSSSRRWSCWWRRLSAVPQAHLVQGRQCAESWSASPPASCCQVTHTHALRKAVDECHVQNLVAFASL